MQHREIVTIGSLFAASGTGPDTELPHRHVDLGPEHPSRSGVLMVQLDSDDGVVTAARVQPGFNHRSVEKLFEVRDYRQVLVLADRHDWQAPFLGELGIALACERMMGLVAPQRATWLRMLLAEQARLASHLSHLTFVAHRLGDEQLAATIREQREQGRQLVLAISGNRVHPMLNRLGGLATDVTSSQVRAVAQWAQQVAQTGDAILDALRNSELGRGLGQINGEQCDALGLSGPVSRASGLDRDLRTEGKYLAYAELSEILHTSMGEQMRGDAHSRFLVLAADLRHGASLVDACAHRLSTIDGPVDTKLSKIVKLPDSQAYLAIEAPWGIAGFHVVSRATPTPWRLRLRTPGFANVQALERALVGCGVDDVDIVMASLGWTAGELDK